MNQPQQQTQQQPQAYYLVTEPPKPPAPKRSWAFPIFAGVITTGLSVIAFGFIAGSQSPDPQPTPSASPSPSEVSTSTPQVTTPSPSPSPVVETQPANVPELVRHQASLEFARIQCANTEVVNFRAAPALNAQVLAVLESGELVELGSQNTVEADGSSWLKVRYRNQSGWIVSRFVQEVRAQ